MADNTFDEIYAKHFLYVRGFLLRLCKGNEHTADDLTQEAFFQAYISIHRFEGNCRVETWLCSIAQNVFYSFLRNEKKQKHVEEMQQRSGDTVYAVQEEQYLEHDAAVAMKRLPQQTAKVLSCRLFHDMPYAEISGLLGISESSAKVIFHRGRIKLMEILKKEYGYEA
ncbi:MAG: RNA polymerase sigma factor [Oscillospiraceae bacterium]|nr:RNA polymerase sigma factor [Oscillospiraceae bacterium]